MKCLVTGAAGFIGSTLVDRLLADGHDVTGYDNFSSGFTEFLAVARARPNFRLIEGDTLDLPCLTAAMAGADTVFHFAANADVRFGLDHPRRDFEQNAAATLNVLQAMRAAGAARIVFASTGSVYGEATVIPTPEDAPFPVQTSLYAASKLAAEGLISAFAEGFGLRAFIFRFVSILGPRYTHGHVFDFYRQLSRNPDELVILGDGTQRKSYLHVQDCIEAVLRALRLAEGRVNIFNLGQDGYIDVNGSVACITAHLGLSPRLSYTGGDRGWIGDNPFIFLDTGRIRALNWRPRTSIPDSLRQTLHWIANNSWVYDRCR